MSTATSFKGQSSPRWWLPLLALLWSEGLFASFCYREELLVTLNIFYTFGLLLWFAFGIGLFLSILQYRDRWAWATLAALVVGIVRVILIDHAALDARRWQAARPGIEAQLPEALKTPLAHEPDELYVVKVLKPGVRVVEDNKGNRWVSFVQYRMGLDNGLAYVYDSGDSVKVEKDGVPEDGVPLGYALSGFGRIARVESLGNHWYRCYFT